MPHNLPNANLSSLRRSHLETDPHEEEGNEVRGGVSSQRSPQGIPAGYSPARDQAEKENPGQMRPSLREVTGRQHEKESLQGNSDSRPETPHKCASEIPPVKNLLQERDQQKGSWKTGTVKTQSGPFKQGQVYQQTESPPQCSQTDPDTESSPQ